MSKHGRVIRNILALLVSQVGTWTTTLILTLVVPPYLGPSLYGLYAFAGTYANFFALGLSLGIGTYLTWRIARNSDQAGRLTFNTLILQIPLGLFFGSLAVGLFPIMDHNTRDLPLIIIVMISTIISALGSTCVSALAGFQNMRVPSFIGVGSAAISALGAIIVVHVHGTIIMLALVGVIGQIINLIVMLSYAQRIIHMRPKVEIRLWPRLIGGGMPFFMWSAVLLFYWQIDVIMLQAMVSESVVGWYSAANRIISIPAFLPNIVGMALLPALSHERTSESAYFRELASRSIRLILAVNIPASAGIILLSGSMLQILHYPAGFAPVVPVIVILSINMPWVALDMILANVLVAVGKQRAWTLVGVVAGVLNPLVNLWAIPFTQHAFGNGAIGASLTTIQSEVIMFTGAMILRPRGIFTRWDIFYILRVLVATGLMVPAVWALSRAGINIVLAVGYGFVVYALAAYGLQVIRNEDLRGALSHLTGKFAPEMSKLTLRELVLFLISGMMAHSAVRYGRTAARALSTRLSVTMWFIRMSFRPLGRRIARVWHMAVYRPIVQIALSPVGNHLRQFRELFEEIDPAIYSADEHAAGNSEWRPTDPSIPAREAVGTGADVGGSRHMNLAGRSDDDSSTSAGASTTSHAYTPNSAFDPASTASRAEIELSR